MGGQQLAPVTRNTTAVTAAERAAVSAAVSSGEVTECRAADMQAAAKLVRRLNWHAHKQHGQQLSCRRVPQSDGSVVVQFKIKTEGTAE